MSEIPPRLSIIEKLYYRYGGGGSGGGKFFLRMRFWQKKYSWLVVLGGARWLKRALDMFVAGFALVCLSPLFLIVAICIKLTDGGPALFWQTRVGRWGKEFSFPKFRSMVTNAEKLKDGLLKRNDHQQSITFKMRRDPRVTWISRIIRKLSIEELPQ